MNIYTEQEKRYLNTIKSNIEHYNAGRRKKRLTIYEYVDNGNRIDVLRDGEKIAFCLTVKEAYYFIFGFIAGGSKK